MQTAVINEDETERSEFRSAELNFGDHKHLIHGRSRAAAGFSKVIAKASAWPNDFIFWI